MSDLSDNPQASQSVFEVVRNAFAVPPALPRAQSSSEGVSIAEDPSPDEDAQPKNLQCKHVKVAIQSLAGWERTGSSAHLSSGPKPIAEKVDRNSASETRPLGKDHSTESPSEPQKFHFGDLSEEEGEKAEGEEEDLTSGMNEFSEKQSCGEDRPSIQLTKRDSRTVELYKKKLSETSNSETLERTHQMLKASRKSSRASQNSDNFSSPFSCLSRDKSGEGELWSFQVETMVEKEIDKIYGTNFSSGSNEVQIHKFSSSEVLNLFEPAPSALVLSPFLSSCSKLRFLDLSNSRIDTVEMIKALAETVRGSAAHCLQDLRMSGNALASLVSVGDHGLKALCRHLLFFLDELKMLSLQKCRLSSASFGWSSNWEGTWKKFKRTRKKLTFLREADAKSSEGFSGFPVDHSIPLSLKQELNFNILKMENLTKLDLAGNAVEEGVDGLCWALQCSYSLHHLNLSRSISTYGIFACSALGRLLSHVQDPREEENCTPAEKFGISLVPGPSPQSSSTGPRLSRFVGLEELVLSDNALGDAAVRCLLEAIEKAPLVGPTLTIGQQENSLERTGVSSQLIPELKRVVERGRVGRLLLTEGPTVDSAPSTLTQLMNTFRDRSYSRVLRKGLDSSSILIGPSIRKRRDVYKTWGAKVRGTGTSETGNLRQGKAYECM